MRRRGAAAVAALVLVGVVLLAVPGSAGAGPAQEPATETTQNPVAPEQDIIPRPNSGAEPHDAGDRGGALQITLFLALVAGVSLIVTLAVRESRRNLRAREQAPAPGPR